MLDLFTKIFKGSWFPQEIMNLFEENEKKKIEDLTKEIRNFSREIEDLKKKQMAIIRLKTPHLRQKFQWVDSAAESRGQRNK